MIDVNKLKIGVTYEEDKTPFRVVKYDFKKLGRGKANIKVKVRNLLTGAMLSKSYLSGNKVEDIQLDKQQMQYLYTEGGLAYFMDPKSFDQIEIDKKVLGADLKYLVEGENAWVVSWNKKVLGVDIPASVVLVVEETDPGAKGNSATGVLKPATLKGGLVVQVPLFIKKRDKLKINTSSGEYVNRVV